MSRRKTRTPWWSTLAMGIRQHRGLRVGDRVGNWEVLDESYRLSDSLKIKALVQCICGRVSLVTNEHLLALSSTECKSCAAGRSEHKNRGEDWVRQWVFTRFEHDESVKRFVRERPGGATFDDMAEYMGVSRQGAQIAVKRALDKVRRTLAELKAAGIEIHPMDEKGETIWEAIDLTDW